MHDEELEQQLGKEIDLRNKAYAERNLCVALIAQLCQMLGHPTGIKVDPTEEAEWQHIFFADLPTGQVSWHLHESELVNFSGLPEYTKSWDGHTTSEKYERVKQFIQMDKGEDHLGWLAPSVMRDWLASLDWNATHTNFRNLGTDGQGMKHLGITATNGINTAVSYFVLTADGWQLAENSTTTLVVQSSTQGQDKI